MNTLLDAMLLRALAIWNDAGMPSRTSALFRCLILVVALPALGSAAQAQLRGHGGPVRALVVAPDSRTVVSGSFDTSVIRWSLDRNAAVDVLRFHEGAVNAVVILPDG